MLADISWDVVFRCFMIFGSWYRHTVDAKPNIFTCERRTFEINDEKHRIWTLAITPKSVGEACPVITNWENLKSQLKDVIDLGVQAEPRLIGSCYTYYEPEWFAEVRFTKTYLHRNGTKTLNPADIWGCRCLDVDFNEVKLMRRKRKQYLKDMAFYLHLLLKNPLAKPNLLTCESRHFRIVDELTIPWTLDVVVLSVGAACPVVTNWGDLKSQLKEYVGRDLSGGSGCFIYYGPDWIAGVKYSEFGYSDWNGHCGELDIDKVKLLAGKQ